MEFWKACLGCLLIVNFVLNAAYAESFKIGLDEIITFGDQEFPNFASYTSSESFQTNGMRCGVDSKNKLLAELTPRLNQRHKRSIADCTMNLTQPMSEYWPTGFSYEIPIWFHVISTSEGVGNISDIAINEQIVVLNEDFGALVGSLGENGFNTKIQFKLEGITRTVNNAWFTDSSADEVSYKTALRKDTNKYLNIYTNDASGLLGYAYYPENVDSVRDGVVMNHQTIGGRNSPNGVYNQGRTLVHEIGHYLGLYHTFHNAGIGSCGNTYSSGDLLIDTNAEATPHFGCFLRSTCGSADPIDNYMGFSDDRCMVKFTAQQANRMVCSLVNYRTQLYDVTSNTSLNNPPVFTSQPKFMFTNLEINIGQIRALDPEKETVSYNLSGGVDQEFFAITSLGELSFLEAPNVNVPQDADGDNIYLIEVQATDGKDVATQAVSILPPGSVVSDFYIVPIPNEGAAVFPL